MHNIAYQVGALVEEAKFKNRNMSSIHAAESNEKRAAEYTGR